MKLNGRIIITMLTLLVSLAAMSYAQVEKRTEVAIPDIPGYRTLKCDFHMHTVFSDGSVWPTVRVEEAWREGLDAIAITDHLEVQPHKKDMPTNHNRSYEIALPRANALGMILIKGVEITKSMPPGHFNAIFIGDADAIDHDDWRKALKAANDQGAFVFWNHPGWVAQAPNGAKWWDEHTELFTNSQFQGIEVVNWYDYYPTVFQWALDKNLTIIGNSDVHPPTNLGFDLAGGAHRPMTLVFAKEKSAEAIKQALIDRRTVAYFENLLIGTEPFLKPIFHGSVKLHNARVKLEAKGRVYVQIQNISQVEFQLVKNGDIQGLTFPETIQLFPLKTVLLELRRAESATPASGTVKLPYTVKNLLIGPDKSLPVELAIEVE